MDRSIHDAAGWKLNRVEVIAATVIVPSLAKGRSTDANRTGPPWAPVFGDRQHTGTRTKFRVVSSNMRLAFLFIPCLCLASDWPQWRGPAGDGISPEKNLPIRWSATENIAWKSPVAGLGTSTPVIWADHVFVTSQIGDGPFEGRSRDFENAVVAKRTGESKQVKFSVQAFDRRTGKLRWDYRFEAEGALQPVHVKHNLASPSCVTDGERVYAWFGTGQLVVLDFDGKLQWRKHLGRDVAPFDVLWGHGSSPTLHHDSLFLLCEHPPGAFLVAVDRRTGK